LRRLRALAISCNCRKCGALQSLLRLLPSSLKRAKVERMGAIRTNAAALMLGVSPSTLRGWERRFGFPAPTRSEGGHRLYELEQIELLRAALQEAGEISAAVALARERGLGPPTDSRLRAALLEYDAERADAILAESLAMRTLERTVESVLLGAVDAIGQEGGLSSEYCFAWRYATSWLCSIQRVSAPATRSEGVLIFDAASALELAALHNQALELFLRRAGLRVLALPTAIAPERLGSALRALAPQAIVLAGSGASIDEIARLVYAARRIAAEALVLDFRGALPDTGATTVGRLASSASAAASELSLALAERTLRGPAKAGRRFVRKGASARIAGGDRHQPADAERRAAGQALA
jgi:DNA-binding transcriptional MerR regulator